MIEETTTTETHLETDSQPDVPSETASASRMDNNLLFAGAVWLMLLSISVAVWGGLAYLLFKWLAD